MKSSITKDNFGATVLLASNAQRATATVLSGRSVSRIVSIEKEDPLLSVIVEQPLVDGELSLRADIADTLYVVYQ